LILLLFQQSAPFAASRGFVAGNLRIRSLSGSFRAPVAVFGAPPLTAVFVCFRGGSKTPRQRLWFETTESGSGQCNLRRLRHFGAATTTNLLGPALPLRRTTGATIQGSVRLSRAKLAESRMATGVTVRRYVRAKQAARETCDAVAARQAACASSVDQSWVEEGQRQRHANGALGAFVTGGEFSEVRNCSFDEPIEPGARRGDGEDQAVAFFRFHSAALAVGQMGHRNSARRL